jgi:hypothetical protein
VLVPAVFSINARSLAHIECVHEVLQTELTVRDLLLLVLVAGIATVVVASVIVVTTIAVVADVEEVNCPDGGDLDLCSCCCSSATQEGR